MKIRKFLEVCGAMRLGMKGECIDEKRMIKVYKYVFQIRSEGH